jgi:hypothetical protein
MLEYLNINNSDSDFIVESDADDASEEEQDATYVTPPAAHPVCDSEENGMDDEDYKEILSLE